MQKALADKLDGYSQFGDLAAAAKITGSSVRTNSRIEIVGNIFNRFPHSIVPAESPIQLKNYEDFVLKENYKKGGVFIANGIRGLVTANNLKGSGLHFYIFAKQPSAYLTNFRICNNVYNLTNINRVWRLSYGIRFWRNYIFTPEDRDYSDVVPESGIRIVNNTFIHPQRKSRDAFVFNRHPIQPIHQPHKSALRAFVALDNKYEDGEPIPASNMLTTGTLSASDGEGCILGVPVEPVPEY